MANTFCAKIKKVNEEVLEGETDEIALQNFVLMPNSLFFKYVYGTNLS